MGRILAIDYGSKRTGIAVTDELQIIASALTNVATKDLFTYLGNYCESTDVSSFVVGEPKRLNLAPTHITQELENFVVKLGQQFPQMAIHRVDERFTSKMASQAILDSGVKKMKRRDKGILDEVSATLILQSYMQSIERKK